MTQDQPAVRSIAWPEIFPWLMIFRSFSLAISMPVLVLATIGVLATPIGWWIGSAVLPNGIPAKAMQQEVAARRTWPVQSAAWQRVTSSTGVLPSKTFAWTGPIQQVATDTVQPFVQLFQRPITWRRFAYYLIGGLWTLFIWSILGGAITRIATIRLGRNDREGMFEAIGFALKRLPAYFGGPLFPLLGIVVIVIMCLPVGWLMHFDVGVFIAGLLWLPVLFGGLFITILLLGLLFGWPLMWGTTSAEEMGDVFEATQRSYSYTFGRPLHYAFYALLALLLGSIGFIVVQYFAEAVIQLSQWAVSWGVGEARWQAIAKANSGIVLIGYTIMRLLNGIVLAVASAYRYGFFWSAVAAIYLLLRRDVDQTEFDDVYVPSDHERYGLPELIKDEHGVPAVNQDATEQSG